jgi:isoprenylcysteine carboxyl methyltransferase (ICMT) family protein YpbQ
MALLCVPLILADTGSRALRLLQLLVLPVLCAFLVQVALAWTPDHVRPMAGRGGSTARRRWAELAALALLMTALRLLTDLWLRRLLFLPEIADWAAFCRKLPFASLVQPLFLVVAVFAFAVRLSARPQRALVAVLLVHQLIVLLQFGRLVDGGTLAAMLLVAGVQGFIMGVAYCRYGLAGPVILAAISYGRHALYLLLPGLAGPTAG